MRHDAEFFAETELDLVFISRRLREALKLESLLTEEGVDYLIKTGTYLGGFLFKRELAGAFFYVPSSDAERARQLLLSNRYLPEV
ncbi:MAG TPA: hypothetical protein VGL97_01540 [Bryobacteraceae bacterium]|jgi:hypothetical protein